MNLVLSWEQKLVLVIAPLVLLLAQIASWWSPDELIHNYYTSRGNLVNTFFVKKGWFWTTVGWLALIYKQRKIPVKSILRFSVATFCWILFTQWLNGMPLMDRIFIWTGGECHVEKSKELPKAITSLFDHISNKDHHISQKVSSMTCRQLKGVWKGGHDPSGHVFLMSLSICLLITELVPLYSSKELIEEFKEFKRSKSLLKSPSLISASIIILSIVMLFMTGIKYHSIPEKLSGLIASYMVLFLVWWLLPSSEN